MCSLMHVKAIGTKKSEILAKITFLGIFGQILPKTPIVQSIQEATQFILGEKVQINLPQMMAVLLC